MNHSLCSNFSKLAMEYEMCLDEAEVDDVLSCPDLSLCNTTQSGDNVGLAFGLTIGAGLATTLGALLPFVPCIKRANTRFLAIGLALAAGVMLYVSFTEIWTKSLDNFCCVTPDHFTLATTACFFAGIGITVLLDLMVAGLQKIECSCCQLSKWQPGLKVRSLRCCCCTRYRNGKISLNGDSVSATNSVVLEKMTENGVQMLATSSHTDNNSFTHERGSGVANGTTHPSTGNGTVATATVVDQDDTVSHNPSVSNSNVLPPSEQQSSETDSRRFVSVVTPDGASVSVISVAPSEGTNNYGTASVNELFSNSSLLRMNAVIPETASLSLAEWGGEGEEKEKREGGGEDGESNSHVSLPVEVSEVTSQNGGLRQRNTAYQEMVSPHPLLV